MYKIQIVGRVFLSLCIAVYRIAIVIYRITILSYTGLL